MLLSISRSLCRISGYQNQAPQKLRVPATLTPLRLSSGHLSYLHTYSRPVQDESAKFGSVTSRDYVSSSKLSTRHWHSRTDRTPLRILFCGSDRFSCVVLEALNQEMQQNLGLIASIDVLHRPSKRSGRGMKILRRVPIVDLATSLGLPTHERDTFTGWPLPTRDGENINLIVAVSFGLFVPPRILKSALYGGLNVHPSLLPDLRGPAPLHHALLAGDTKTGVTLQTLHAAQFDHGRILAQELLPIPNPDSCTYDQLLKLVTPAAAKIIVDGLRNGVYLPEYSSAYDGLEASSAELRHAPKITSQDTCIQWSMSPEVIVRQQRVLGPLWSNVLLGSTWRRVLFSGLSVVAADAWPEASNESGDIIESEKQLTVKAGDSEGPKQQITISVIKQNEGVAIVLPNRSDGLFVRSITIEGGKKMGATEALFPRKLLHPVGHSREYV